VTRPESEELLAVAVRVAAEAAAIHARRPDALDVVAKSTATDPVTQVDEAAEACIVAGILAVRPDDGFLGEEGTDRPGTSGVRWVFDPLDGTVNYVYGLPAYGVSVAAEVDGRVMAGVVHDSAREEVFTAVRGGGAQFDGVPIRAIRPASVSATLLATGFAYAAERRAWQAAVLTRIVPAVRDIRRSGSAAIDLAATACGRIDAFYEVGLRRWDMAAGSLLCEEVGLVVRWDGARRRLLVAGPHVIDELDALIAAAEAAAGAVPGESARTVTE
jgi:myo-inositol-1(or 4)-monophosphatase